MSKFNQEETSSEQKWIVGAAWPYVHQVPHLGNFLCILAADVFTRFFRLFGDEVVMVSGSDEHGARMEFEAEKQDISPQELVDKNHEKVVEALDYFNIGFKKFGKYSRTTAKHHEDFVQNFYKKVYKNEHIFTKVEVLPYCPNCEKFLPDRFIVGTCPHCGFEDARGNQCDKCGRILDPSDLVEPTCAICESKPAFKETKHWYLDLPALSDQIKEYVKKQKHWPDRVKHFTLRWIEEGLKPRPITRDIKFGIPTPFENAEDKTIYVWFDAVLGYISTTKAWASENNGGKGGEKEKGKEKKKFEYFWKDPETKLLFTQGKDNIPFHTIIFPALIFASEEDYVLPYQIYSNEYIGFEGKQFSKSRRIGIWINEAMDLLENPDYWRYYLFSIFPEKKDTNFKWDDFEKKINDELIGNFGNFINRVLSFLHQSFNGKVPQFEELEREEERVLEKMNKIIKEEREAIENFKLKEGLKKVLELSIIGNEFFQHQKPWKTINSDPEKCRRTLYVCANICKTLAILISPYLPNTAEKIWDTLDIKESINDAHWEEAFKLMIKPAHQIKEPEILFEKVEKEELQKELKDMREIKNEKMEKEKTKIKIQDFGKLDLRVGKIIEAEPVEDASKLFKLKVDIGTKELQTVAGIAEHYSLEDIIDKQVVMITNLEPANIKGIKSEGMILAAVEDEDISLITVDKRVSLGTEVK